MRDSKLNEILNKFTIEEIKNIYYNSKHKDCAKILGIAVNNLPELIDRLGIDRRKRKKTTIEEIAFKVSKEKLINYYILENHSSIETQKYFGINELDIKNLFIFYGIENKKEYRTKEIKNKNINKEELYQYYIIENHNREETINYFNLKSVFQLEYWLDRYNIIKLDKRKHEVTKEKLKTYYIDENHGYMDTCHHFTIGSNTLIKLIHKYGLNKFKEKEKFEHIVQRINKEEFENYIKLHSKEEIAQYFNIAPYDKIFYRICKYFNIETITFVKENELLNYIYSLGVVRTEKHNRKILGNGQEIDIYLPDYKIGIEFNGNYWHSDLFKDKYYHFNKSKLAEEKGIKLIHIWEYEWDNPQIREKIKSLLNIALGVTPSKIYARNCEIKQITNAEAKPFNEANHFQGHRNAQVTYGLFYQGKLVQLMSFSKTKYNRNLKSENSWEIIKGCSDSNNIVVGGVSKLFSHFIKDYSPDSIFSYCDFNKFDGKGYEAIGMKFIGYTGPDMKLILDFNNYSSIISYQPNKYKELQKQAIAKIWDPGNKKYLWIKPRN